MSDYFGVSFLQDTLGGRFDATQSFVGEMSDLHMWSHVLSATDIYSLASCGSYLRGDVIAWSDTEMELHGGVSRYPFNPCHWKVKQRNNVGNVLERNENISIIGTTETEDGARMKQQSLWPSVPLTGVLWHQLFHHLNHCLSFNIISDSLIRK